MFTDMYTIFAQTHMYMFKEYTRF